MRKVNYIAKRQDGTKFITTNYTEATTDGNRIFKTFLSEIKEESPKDKEWMRGHAQRIAKVIAEKGSL